MLSNFVKEGDRIDLMAVDRAATYPGMEQERAKVYTTKIASILTEDTMEILMPMEQTKLILLPVDGEYNIVFYASSGLFQCFARVIDRYKSNNLYIVAMELTSNLRKYQRREYYRFSCALEMCARNLMEEEVQQLEERNPLYLQPNLPIRRSVIVDISGGGLRFMSNQQYEPGSMIYCSYDLLKGGERKKYEVVGKVLAVRELENRPNTYEHRVQYVNINEAVREEIIQFIFEEERKNRKTR
jgi:c-di-GMP-binding flagellar brake protein YcgR